MIDGELARTFMLSLLMVQTSFRQAIQRSMKKNNIDLTFEMLQIMVCLWRKDGVNQQELATLTFKDKASLSPLLNNLEEKELVVRRADKVDKRSKMVYLTVQGIDCGARVKPLLQEIYSAAEKEVDHTHIDLCINYLQELNHVFKKE